MLIVLRQRVDVILVGRQPSIYTQIPVCALSQVSRLLHHRLRRDMERGGKLIPEPQPVGLVRNSLWGASAGGWQDVSMLGLEDLLLKEVLLV